MGRCLYFGRKMAKNRDFPGGEKSGNFSPPGAPPPGGPPRAREISGNSGDGGSRGSGRALHPPLGKKISDAEIFSGRKKNFRRKKKFFGRKKNFFSPPQEKNFFFPRGTLSARLPRRAYGTCGHSEMD